MDLHFPGTGCPPPGHITCPLSCQVYNGKRTTHPAGLDGPTSSRQRVPCAGPGSASQKDQVHPPLLPPLPSATGGLGGGRCGWRRCPQAGHMPTGLGLSLLQESTPPTPPTLTKPHPFSPAPSLHPGCKDNLSAPSHPLRLLLHYQIWSP